MKRMITFLLIIVILSACNGKSVFDKEIEKTKSDNVKRLLEEADYKKKWEDFYEPKSRPLEEVVNETANDSTVINSSSFEVKQLYTDPEEFAVFVSDNIYRFMKSELKPEDYLTFLIKYSSNLYKEKHLVGEKEKDIQSITIIQKAMANEGKGMKSYRVSIVKPVDYNNTISNFYREITLDTGQRIYYLTSIIKEEGGWKFDDDRLSAPINFLPSNEEKDE